MKYSTTVTVEAVTFDELVEYGTEYLKVRNYSPPGSRWSFEYGGQPIVHENNILFLIHTIKGCLEVTPDDMLITGVTGELFIRTIEAFEKIYTKVEE